MCNFKKDVHVASGIRGLIFFVATHQVDFRSPLASTFTYNHRNWTIPANVWDVRVEFSVINTTSSTWSTAKVLATDSRGIATVLEHEVAGSMFTVVTFPADVAFDAVDLKQWYATMLHLDHKGAP